MANEAMIKLRAFVREQFTPEAAEVIMARLRPPPTELERMKAKQRVASRAEYKAKGIPDPVEES